MHLTDARIVGEKTSFSPMSIMERGRRDSCDELLQLALPEDQLSIVNADGLGNLLAAQQSFKCPRLEEVKLKGAAPPSLRALAFAHQATLSGVGVWNELEELARANPELHRLREGLTKTVAASRAENTFKVYTPMVAAWEGFANLHGLCAFPASRAGLLLYLQGRFERALDSGTRESFFF